jgi:hypothetical protein
MGASAFDLTSEDFDLEEVVSDSLRRWADRNNYLGGFPDGWRQDLSEYLAGFRSRLGELGKFDSKEFTADVDRVVVCFGSTLLRR